MTETTPPADSQDTWVEPTPAPDAAPAADPAPAGTPVETPTDAAVVTPVEGAPADAPVDPAQTPPVDPAPAEPTPADPQPGPTPEVTEEPTSTEVTPDSSGPSGGTQINVQANAENAAATPAEEQASTETPEVPAAPVIETPHADEEFGDNVVHVSGTAEPSGATVTVYADSREIGTASVDDKGDWSIEANLPNAEYVLSASVNDTGRISERSEGVHIIVNHDAGAPAPEPSSDPDVRFAEFLRANLLRGYPLRWERITELQAATEAWIADKGL